MIMKEVVSKNVRRRAWHKAKRHCIIIRKSDSWGFIQTWHYILVRTMLDANY